MAIRMSGMISGLDTDAIIKDLMKAQSDKKTKLEQTKEKLGWKKEKWEEMNTKVYALYTEKLSSLKLQGTYLAKKAVSSDETKAKVSATNTSSGSYKLQIDELASAEYVTGKDIKDKGYKADTKLADTGMTVGQKITIKTGRDQDKSFELEVTEDTKISDLVNKFKEAGLNASFDSVNGRFFIGAQDSGSDSLFTFSSDAASGAGLENLGLTNVTEEMAKTGATATDTDQIAIVAAKDSRITLNGAVLTSSKNSIEANGMTIELLGVTSGAVNITVNNDVDTVYDKVKEFVNSYNELLTDMYEKYNADSAKGYNMLTDDEKEAMSEEQVELWENKIKDSLLRRDDTLNSLMSAFRSAMQESVEVDGKKYSLSSFGIGTGEYTEHGLLHINGNADDSMYADKTDSLKAALTENPEVVSKALSGIMSKFYSTLSDKMSASSISSALTLYNDKQIQSQMNDYETQIKKWDTRLQDIEDRYYKQFSAMEKSLADLQSKQSQLSGMFGM